MVLEPFTLPHFRHWTSDLLLDTEEPVQLEPFQGAFVEDVFTGCAECWLVVPEGNGKTTLIALLALYHCEHRPNASVVVAASSREQAEFLYRQAEGIVLRSPRLIQRVHSPVQEAKGKQKLMVPRFEVREGYRRIQHANGGRIQIYAADDRTGDGAIPTLAILDELHRHRDLSLYRTWAGKLTKRGGQLVAISTAGEPGSDFENTRERIRQQAQVFRQGSFTRAVATRMILHEWAVPEGADIEDMEVVKAANPFSGVTVESLTDKFDSPTMTREHWSRFVCNVPTRGNNAAIQEAEWEAARTDDVIPKGVPVWLGLDVAWKWDTTAAVPLWYRDNEYRLFGTPTILTPPRDGTSLDPRDLRHAITTIHKRNPIQTVVMDTSKAEGEAMWLESELGTVVIDRPQTNMYAAQDYDRFMEALRNGWLRHPGDPDFTQHVLNAVARLLPGGDTRFDRPVESRRADQERRVIDALTAASMVHAHAVDNALKPPEVKKVYRPTVFGLA